MKDNTDSTNQRFQVPNESADDAGQFGAEASAEALKKVKGGFGDVKGDACVAAAGAIMTTHNEGMSQK